MDQKLLLVAVLGFFAGYILRAIISSYKIFMEMSEFVAGRSDDCLKLIGEAVYKIAYVDELCYKAFKDIDPEGAKILRIELEENFQEWKKNVILSLVDSYPSAYKWHLDYSDWESAMERLTHIYRKEQLSNDR